MRLKELLIGKEEEENMCFFFLAFMELFIVYTL
jgi:hypothetical protein